MKKKQSGHAKFSPSASHRWLECPGSVELSATCPEPPESAAAMEGTAAHTCLEILLKNGIERKLNTEIVLREKYPLQMVMHAAWAANAIWALTPKGAELLSETKSELFHIDPEMHGTTDASIIQDFGTLQIIDYKYGRMPVEVEGNTQMIAYAIGIAHKYHYNFDRVTCTVIQPRANHNAGPIRSWTTTIENLLEWTDRFREGVELAKSLDPPFKSGEHCFFCPAKKVCFEYTPESESSRRSRFVTQASPEQRRAQLVLDFGDTSGTNNKHKTPSRK